MILAVFLISIFTFLFLGIPVAFSILLTVLTMAEASGVTSYEIVPSYLYSGVNNFALLAIPFFVFCGDLMTAGDLSKGIVEFCRVLLGHVRAGIGLCRHSGMHDFRSSDRRGSRDDFRYRWYHAADHDQRGL